MRADVDHHVADLLSRLDESIRLDDVVKCTVYLKDMGDFQAMNEVFARFFPDHPPARTTVQAALAEPEMLVEIEAIAYVD